VQQRKLPHEERLALAAAFLERLAQDRARIGDPNLDKAFEKRIIWRELLDLELQEFDEEIQRLGDVAEGLLASAEAKHS
jgi:hypothetical protein